MALKHELKGLFPALTSVRRARRSGRKAAIEGQNRLFLRLIPTNSIPEVTRAPAWRVLRC